MSTVLQLVQSEKISGKLHAVAQCRGGLRVFRDWIAFAFPLPRPFAIEGFGINMLPLRGDIDSHPAWAHGAINPVNFERGIDNMEIDLN